MRTSARPAQAGRHTARTLVILAIASGTGSLVGVLTYIASRSAAQALLAAGTAAGGTTSFLRQIMAPDPRPPARIPPDIQDETTEQITQ
jgi:hypothetical protein